MENTPTAKYKDLAIGVLIGIIVLLVAYMLLRDTLFKGMLGGGQAQVADVDTTGDSELQQTNEETGTPWEIVSDGPNIKRFYWYQQGLAFMYSPYVYVETEAYFGPDLQRAIEDPSIDVAGRIVFPRGSLEVFDRDPADSPERSIRLRFLNGENTSACTVRRSYPNDEDIVYLATPGVTYVRMVGSGCPELYRGDANAATAFFVLDAVPDRLFFVTTSDGENVSLRTPDGVPFFATFNSLPAGEETVN